MSCSSAVDQTQPAPSSTDVLLLFSSYSDTVYFSFHQELKKNMGQVFGVALFNEGAADTILSYSLSSPFICIPELQIQRRLASVDRKPFILHPC